MNTARSNRNATSGGPRRFFKLRYGIPIAALLLAASALAQKSDSQDALVRRYPYDPACPWGRIGNGKGMIVRCISESEAEQLLKRTPVTKPADATPAGTATASASAPAEAAPPAETPAAGPESLEVSVGPIIADQGELSLTKLAQPKTRYARCVLDHGGLKDRSGEVHVRFLVRSKGIAEGVSVHKRVNVSADAARCVADIVDRRRVGTPDAPLVGATVIVKFDKTGQ